jgi:PKD repeat protein
MAQITGGHLSTLTFQWGDGTTDITTGFPASHTYTSPGTYQITVTATDDHGLSASATTTATIYYNCGNRCPE